MCIQDKEPREELKRLPEMLKEHGWSASPIHCNYSATSPGDWLQGSSGPTETHQGITLFTGTAFQVIAREEDLKVRVGWPGQMTTTYTCFTAEQVVWWLSKLLPLADKEIAERRKSNDF